jgi:diacylglycerol kinase (ATP)
MNKQTPTGPIYRLYLAACNTGRGLAHAVRHEAAVRDETTALAIALPLAAFIAPNFAWYAAMIGVLLATLAVELLNTAIEKLADHVAPEWNAAIGLIKDYGSAAVACMLLTAALVWLAALLQKFNLV